MASEEKAPSDRLYDEGCPFCGGIIDGYMHAVTLDGQRAYCTKHSREPWYGNAGPEYDRRKSLRPSQPSAEREGPYVPKTGERVRVTHVAENHGDAFWKVGGEYEVMCVSPADPRFHSHVGCVALHAVGQPQFGAWVKVEPVSAPSADKFNVGDLVSGMLWNDHPDTFVGTYQGERKHGNGTVYAAVSCPKDGHDMLMKRETLKLRPATPSPKAAAVPKCALHRTENCINCADAARALAATQAQPKLDPDGFLNREALDERRRGERLAFGARRLAAIEAHKLDLDRKIPTVRGRLAAEVKAALRTWPEAEED